MPPSQQGEEETNVRVAARVRPLLPRETALNCCSCVTVHAGNNQLVVGTKRAFSFDTVFDGDAKQSVVYNTCAVPLLDGCMQGYNATILAYGQTGSGKTHTMGTGQDLGEGADEEGITPKVIRQTFEYVEAHKSDGDFKVSCCYLEIYNDDLRDLLQPGGSKHRIAVREDAAGGVKVTGIHAETCSSADEMLRCLGDGSVQRTTGATLMNEMSSRSHSIFTVIIEQRRCRSSVTGSAPAEGLDENYTTAKFHLVDLAGSERAKRTGAVGSRFKESVSINSGLLALGNVISALGDPAKKGSHVPYRESKLTRLLQDSLGGNSRTMMIACISSADGDFEETLNTLKYAHRARNIKNKPVVNHDPRTAQLAAMQDEIESLRSQLQRANGGSMSLAPDVGPSASPGRGAVSAEEVCELNAKLEQSQARSSELVERLAGNEAEAEALRRCLVDLYTSVCQHLPAIYQERNAPGSETAAPSPGRQALTAICETLIATHRLLDSTEGIAGGSATESGADRGQADCYRLPPLPLHLAGFGTVANNADCPPELTGIADASATLKLAGTQQLGETGRLQSLAEVRRDSAPLIRKYLDEMHRLETEVALHRRRTKQLQDELKEARDDLQKDEEIFEEKMREMKDLADRNERLEAELRELRAEPHGAISKDANNYAIQLFTASDAEASSSRHEESERPVSTTNAEDQLDESCTSRKLLEEQLQSLSQSVRLKEDLIEELTRSEQEWGVAKAKYQQRMEQLQAELEETQHQLDEVQVQLQKSVGVEKQARLAIEEEKKRLERAVVDQVDALRRKQQEFQRLKELRTTDTRRVKDLEAEVAQMRGNQADLDRKLQAERKREGQHITDLQRRLVREGQKVKELEASLRQANQQTPPMRRPGSSGSVPMSRKSSSGGMDRAERGSSKGYPPATPASSEVLSDRGGGGSASSSSSGSRWQRFEQQLDEHIKILEVSQGLEEDLQKQDALLKKREQYLSYQRKIAARDATEQQEAKDRLAQLEAEIQRQERVADSESMDPTERQAQAEVRLALKKEHVEFQRTVQKKRAEGLSILHDIDERLEGLQDELDFREARIARARAMLEAMDSGTGSLHAELERLPAEDGKELLRRYCEKLVKLRQREKQHWQRLAASEAQLEERGRQVAELQQVLRRQDSNSTKAIAKVTKEYENRIRQLLRQLSSSQRESEDPSDQPVDSEETEQLRRDNQYYKAVNRELKRRLRQFYEQRGEVGESLASVSSDGRSASRGPP
eukprot:TRINITY_DN32108_c0_g1_i1.p1 TRINITY_DN32108_c0_g1~~TRINITY_DN32108_c0_g1_i1.p1  ORF type:complete len:1252 (-),score=305.27 TRINITY_DN32108_c0_g1_i1:70-3825(-)